MSNSDNPKPPIPEVLSQEKSAQILAHETRADAVHAESIKLQYESMPAAYVASGVLATVVVAIYQQSMPAHIWIAWIMAMYLHVFARRRLRQRFLQVTPPSHDIARWGHYAVLGTLASGVLWGVGTVLGLIYSEAVMGFLIAPLILLFSVAAAISSISYLPVFYAFFIPSTMPAIVVFLMESDKLRFLTGIAYLCFMLMVIRFAHVLHKSFMTSTQLRFENTDLVEALRTEKSIAEEANLAKSRFLAAASHDLRQPMHALSLFIESFPTSKLEANEAEIIANMRRSAGAMTSLFDSLLDMSRLDAGVVEPKPEHFDIGQFGTRLYREFAPMAQAQGLQLRLRNCNCVVAADPVLLNRIITNLLSNAIRYGAREGILLALRPHQGRLAIEVWDTGIGISEADRAAIFLEFYQVGNPEREREKGLGLGLAIVDRLVRLMGLSLQVRSRPGVGSMFRLLVPLGQQMHVKEISQDHPSAQADLAEHYALFVIVIDDEQTVRGATSQLLRSWGCSVLAAGSAEELKAQAPGDTRIPDLIIADLRLRGDATGITEIKTLRTRFGHDIPSVIITGDTIPARLQQVRDSGLEVLHKPLRPDALRQLLSRLQVPQASMPAPPGGFAPHQAPSA